MHIFLSLSLFSFFDALGKTIIPALLGVEAAHPVWLIIID